MAEIFFFFELRQIKKTTWFASVMCNTKSRSYQYYSLGLKGVHRPKLSNLGPIFFFGWVLVGSEQALAPVQLLDTFAEGAWDKLPKT